MSDTPRTDAFGSEMVGPGEPELVDQWAEFCRTLERELAAARDSFSESVSKLAEIEKWATSARRTDSRDIRDWKDDMLNIENIVQRAPK